jgi:hypothetical protein
MGTATTSLCRKLRLWNKFSSPATNALSRYCRNNPRNRHDNTWTGRRNPFRQGIQLLPPGAMPPPGTRKCRCGCMGRIYLPIPRPAHNSNTRKPDYQLARVGPFVVSSKPDMSPDRRWGNPDEKGDSCYVRRHGRDRRYRFCRYHLSGQWRRCLDQCVQPFRPACRQPRGWLIGSNCTRGRIAPPSGLVTMLSIRSM